ncbi:MAG: hypothetical protein NMNS01_25360 [Nitrosomonas sp.]|nr:MAG: hypothetical protein NMNS01_25360 [Nitrosomonas sp.]
MNKFVENTAAWIECTFDDLLDYIQPTNYIVDSTEYDDNFQTPVLTAGKSFIKGYTNEKHGIFENLPAIIFDDFTTASKYVNFSFKVKSSAMKILAPCCELVNLKFLYYFMQANPIRSDTHKRYWISVYAKKSLLLPPLNEQKRIVGKIEELFSELDKGIESLKTAREQLKVYRQAVLKHAFEGKLTVDWREENKDKLETADELMKRIKQEREAAYQQQLDDWKVVVKQWEQNDKEGKKPKKPRPLDVSVKYNDFGIPTLPQLWMQSQLTDLIADLTDYHANGSYEVLKENVELQDTDDYALMIRATCFEKNNFTENQKYISEKAYNFLSKSKLYGGEILIGKIGNAGKVYFMPELNRPTSLAMNLFCLRFKSVSSKYIYLHLLSSYSSKDIAKFVKGVGNPTIDKISIRSLNIALPPIEEQNQILRKIETTFSIIDQLEADIENNLQKSEALRQSILKQAFSGKLVVQDPKDEPASVLLQRIKDEKDNSKKKRNAA